MRSYGTTGSRYISIVPERLIPAAAPYRANKSLDVVMRALNLGSEFLVTEDVAKYGS